MTRKLMNLLLINLSWCMKTNGLLKWREWIPWCFLWFKIILWFHTLILSSQIFFTNVMECKSSFFFMLPKLIIIMRQVLHTRVLILIHFKTRGQVFSNQRSMMQGTKILCFNLQLILFLNLVINIEGLGFKLDVFHIGVIPKTLFNSYSCNGERQINSNKVNYYELRNVSSLFSLFGGDA